MTRAIKVAKPAVFDPSQPERFQLAEIRRRESSNNYISSPANPPYATASGAYQFIRATWAWVSARTGVGISWIDASAAPPDAQDINALYLLRRYGANSSMSWAASGPYPSLVEIEEALKAVWLHDLT